MDLDIATKSILSMFFVYLVMFGSYINVLLNCGLQRFLLNNIYLRHIIVFSLFLFLHLYLIGIHQNPLL